MMLVSACTRAGAQRVPTLLLPYGLIRLAVMGWVTIAPDFYPLYAAHQEAGSSRVKAVRIRPCFRFTRGHVDRSM